jgi:hypothetical protein
MLKECKINNTKNNCNIYNGRRKLTVEGHVIEEEKRLKKI